MQRSLHHTFDIQLAQQYGIEEAILIHHFQFWIMVNIRQGVNLHEGRIWTFQKHKAMLAIFPYFKTRHKFKNLIKSLVDQGVLITGCFNENKWDRTTWYAFADQERFVGGFSYDPELEEDEEDLSPKIKEKFANEQKRSIERADLPHAGAKMLHGKSKNAHSIDKDITEDITKKKDVCATHSPLISSSYPDIQITPAEEAKLLEKYSPEMLQKCYKFLSEWKEGKSKKELGTHKDAARIKRWVVLAVREEELKIQELDQKEARLNPKSKDSANRAEAEKILSKCVIPNHIEVELCNSYVEIKVHGSAHAFNLRYDENNFRDQFINMLRKFNIGVNVNKK